MKQPLTFFVFQKHSLFIPLRYVYGECFTLIDGKDQLYPLICLEKNSCPVNVGCMDILAKRINYLFCNVVPEAKQVIAYFKYPNRPNSIRAGIFDRDLSDPRVRTLNRSAFNKFQKESLGMTWIPTDEYLLMRPVAGLIPVESLLIKPHE